LRRKRQRQGVSLAEKETIKKRKRRPQEERARKSMTRRRIRDSLRMRQSIISLVLCHKLH